MIRALSAGVLLGATSMSAPAPAHAAQPRMLEASVAEGPISFTVFLPRTAERSAQLERLIQSQQTPGSADYRRWLTPQQYAARFGADAALVARATAELEGAGLTVESLSAHGLRVSGMASSVERAFATRLHQAVTASGAPAIAAAARLTMTPALAEAGAHIPAFDVSYGFRRHSLPAVMLPASATGPYYTGELRQAYQAPAQQVATGRGATIAILMEAAYLPSDIAAYFAAQGLTQPTVSRIDVDGGAAFSPSLSDEVTLDIDSSGGIAPGARIVDYNLPNLHDQSLIDGLTAILSDNIADVVSMSFGEPEVFFSSSYNVASLANLRAEQTLFQQGNAQGITFIASSGDGGAKPAPAFACLAGGRAGCGGFVYSAEFPASSSNVTGVGGTNLVTTLSGNSLDATIVRQNAYYDLLAGDPFYGTQATGAIWGSGGGASILFNRPSWQQTTGQGTKYRTVPDVAGHMGGCPSVAVKPCGADRSGDAIVLNGSTVGVVGTSASAPNFAGVIALAVGQYGRLGNVNPAIYAAKGPNTFISGIAGNNGYPTANGYDLVIGLGTPKIAVLVGDGGNALAGPLGTPSNP